MSIPGIDFGGGGGGYMLSVFVTPCTAQKGRCRCPYIYMYVSKIFWGTTL